MKKIGISILVCVLVIGIIYACFSNLEVYFEELLTQSKNNKGEYAILSLVILSSDIILPIPSSVIMFLNGLVLGVIKGALLALAASMISAMVGYYLGRLGSKSLKKSPDNESISILKMYGSFGVIITRGIPILAESICFTAGYLNMNLRYYLVLNFVGYFPICLIYAYFGSMGQSQYLFLISFGSSILVSLVLWVFGRKLLGRLAEG